jgi:hypothetical protein
MPFEIGFKKLKSNMKLRIKNLTVNSSEIAELELEFRDTNGKHLGDLIIKPTDLTWNKGKKSKTGKSLAWEEVFKRM